MRSSLPRAVFAAFLLLLTCLIWAQVKVKPPTTGTWEAWIGPGVPGGNTNYKSSGAVIDLPLGGTEDGDQVTVYDGRTGNLAMKLLGDIDNTWEVSADEFSTVAVIMVEVTHNGSPVAAANVSIKTASRTQTLLLTPSQNGKLTFKNVSAGPLQITVSTSKDGKPVQTPKQTFTLSLARRDVAPTFRVALADPVDVVGETKPSPSTVSPPSAAPAPPSNPISNILSMIVGLGFIGLIAYLAWRFLPQFKPQIDAQLQKVGVHIPDDQTRDDDPPVVPVLARAPVEPIMLGAAAIPTVASVAVPTVSMPTLINQDTMARVEISEGTHRVTREPGSLMTIAGSTAISRQHAEVERVGDALVLRDLGSTNGTFLNGVKVAGDVNLKTGDLVQFGDVAFRVEGV